MPVSASPRPPLPLWAALVAAVAGGLLLDVAFPSVGWWPMAFAAVALALVSLIGRGAWSALLTGFVFGMAFYLMNVDFTAEWVGPLPWAALSVLESLFVALGALLITLAYRWVPRVLPRRWARLTVLPAIVAGLWTGREQLNGGFPYGGFPWGRVGTSQVNGPLAEVVSWTGTAGLSFLVVAVVAVAIEIVRTMPARPEGFRKGLVPTASVVAVLALLMLVPAFPTTPAGELKVASVQGNGPAGYFDERQAGDVLASQYAATEPLFGADVDVVLWPEGGVDLDPDRSAVASHALNEVSRELDAPVVANRIRQEGEDRFFNTSFVWQADEGITQTYDKRNPVPFGEYVPDRAFYRSIAPDLIDMIGRDYTPGTSDPVFDVGGTKAGLAICFDVIYDSLIWEGARDGAEVYLFQTNNADFLGTDENLQQLAVARLRAIETGRSVVNISTVGTSQVIGPDGRTTDALPADEPGAMTTNVELRVGLTFAVLAGPLIAGFLVWAPVVALFVFGGIAYRRRKAKTPAPEGTGVS